MKNQKITIHAYFDDEKKVWYASWDPASVVAEDSSLDVLTYKLQTLIPEFAELNHLELPKPILLEILAHRSVEAFA